MVVFLILRHSELSGHHPEVDILGPFPYLQPSVFLFEGGTMTLGWAIITTGLHADVKIAPALHATPDAELVAVYSRDQGRASLCPEAWGQSGV